MSEATNGETPQNNELNGNGSGLPVDQQVIPQAPQPVNPFANFSPKDISAICKARPDFDLSLESLRMMATLSMNMVADLEEMKKRDKTIMETKEYILGCHSTISSHMNKINRAINKFKTFFPSVDFTMLDDFLAEVVSSINKLKKLVDVLESCREADIYVIEGFVSLIKGYSLKTRICFKNMLQSICDQTEGWWEDLNDYSDDDDHDGSGKFGGRRGGRHGGRSNGKLKRSGKDHTDPKERDDEPQTKKSKTGEPGDQPMEKDTPAGPTCTLPSFPHEDLTLKDSTQQTENQKTGVLDYSAGSAGIVPFANQHAADENTQDSRDMPSSLGKRTPFSHPDHSAKHVSNQSEATDPVDPTQNELDDKQFAGPSLVNPLLQDQENIQVLSRSPELSESPFEFSSPLKTFVDSDAQPTSGSPPAIDYTGDIVHVLPESEVQEEQELTQQDVGPGTDVAPIHLESSEVSRETDEHLEEEPVSDTPPEAVNTGSIFQSLQEEVPGTSAAPSLTQVIDQPPAIAEHYQFPGVTNFHDGNFQDMDQSPSPSSQVDSHHPAPFHLNVPGCSMSNVPVTPNFEGPSTSGVSAHDDSGAPSTSGSPPAADHTEDSEDSVQPPVNVPLESEVQEEQEHTHQHETPGTDLAPIYFESSEISKEADDTLEKQSVSDTPPEAVHTGNILQPLAPVRFEQGLQEEVFGTSSAPSLTQAIGQPPAIAGHYQFPGVPYSGFHYGNFQDVDQSPGPSLAADSHHPAPFYPNVPGCSSSHVPVTPDFEGPSTSGVQPYPAPKRNDTNWPPRTLPMLDDYGYGPLETLEGLSPSSTRSATPPDTAIQIVPEIPEIPKTPEIPQTAPKKNNRRKKGVRNQWYGQHSAKKNVPRTKPPVSIPIPSTSKAYLIYSESDDESIDQFATDTLPIVISASTEVIKSRVEESNKRFALLGILSGQEFDPSMKVMMYKVADLRNEAEVSALAYLDKSVVYDRPDYRGLGEYFKKVITPDVTELLGKPDKDRVIRPKLTGPIHIDPLSLKAEDIQKRMKDALVDGQNMVFATKTKVHLPNEGMDECNKDQEFYKQHGYTGEHEKDFPGKLLATPCFDFEGTDPEERKKLAELMSKFPISVASNVGKACGIDYEMFSIEKFLEETVEKKPVGKRKVGRKAAEKKELEKEKKQIDVFRQFAQGEETNWTFVKNASPWRVFGDEGKIDFKKFGENYTKLKEIFVEAGKKVDHNWKKEELDGLIKEILENQLESEAENGSEERLLWDKFKPILLSFGTNFDLTEKQCPELYSMLRQNLPFGFQPNADGDLLKLTGLDHPGINEIQLYFKAPGSRTSVHIETAALYSVNFNVGPGKCTWYAVPPEFAGAMEELIREKLGVIEDGELVKRNSYGTKVWPSLKELADRNIPVYKFVQEPDQMVYVGPLTYHWVETTGFTTNISYNVGLPTKTQLDAMIVMYDHATTRGVTTTIPVPSILWKIAAKNAPDAHDTGFFKSVKYSLARLLAVDKYDELVCKKWNPREIVYHSERTISFEHTCKACGRSIVNTWAMERGVPESRRNIYCIGCVSEATNPKFWRKRDGVFSRKTFDKYVLPKPEEATQRPETDAPN